MAGALLAIRREPPPRGRGARPRALLADLRGGIEIYNGHLRERVDFARRALRFERRIARLRASAPRCGGCWRCAASRWSESPRGRCAR